MSPEEKERDVFDRRRSGMLNGLRAVALALIFSVTNEARCIEPAELPAEALAPCEVEGQAAAVALNYCRASFHRIRKYPSKRVLLEEQEKILNNLNLNGIGDEEVVKLYTAVLAEISDVRIAEKEREFIQAKFRQTLERQVVTNAYKLATEVATQQYVAAVRTGAHSWWDYRTLGWHRDLDVWKVERERMIAVVDKSSLFLDTFWKLTRKHPIPDRWLVRSDDLDRLEEALREPDLEVRLRVLKRMEPFMECYPPYWYYVGRTQQGLGQLFAAAATYEKLVELGAGHFRKDEMLAAALANRALIQEYLNQSGAPESAKQALRYSVDVWEVNIMSAHVLERHGRVAEAEDAILRNLDTGLERDQSLACLLTVYARSKNRAKLLPHLASQETVRRLPAPVLFDCLAAVGAEGLTPAVQSHLGSSLYSYVDLKFGRDDVVVSALPCWDLQSWQLSLTVDGHRFAQPEMVPGRGYHELRFRGVAEFGTPLKPGVALPMTLTLAQGETVALDLHLLHLPGQPPGAAAMPDPFLLVAGDASREPQLPPRPGAWRIQAADVRGTRVAVGTAGAVPAGPAGGVAMPANASPAATPLTVPVSAPRAPVPVRTAPVELGPIEVAP